MMTRGFFARVRSDAHRALPDTGYGRTVTPADSVVAPDGTHSPPPRARRLSESRSEPNPSSMDAAIHGNESSRHRIVENRIRTTERQRENRDTDSMDSQPDSPSGIRSPQASEAALERATETISSPGQPRSVAESNDAPAASNRRVEHRSEMASETRSARFAREGQHPSDREMDLPPSENPVGHERMPVPEQVSRSIEDVARPEERRFESREGTPTPESAPAPAGEREPGQSQDPTPSVGREQSEPPVYSDRPSPAKRDRPPPGLHIGEVVIRVEEEPKPQRGQRRKRPSTPSDSQRLIRSL